MRLKVNLIIKSQHLLRKFSSQIQVCIIGSGPSAFYTAQTLLKNNAGVNIDMFEKLPSPFGLVRYGVAPDHPEVKNVINTFTEVAKNPRFSFFGNVCIGKDVKLKELQEAYSVIIWAYGAAIDRRLNIPGEDLPGVLSAKDVVGCKFSPDLNCDAVAIIGMGNVAIDVARILLSPIDRLKSTDIPEPVIDCLSKSKVRTVTLIGRRGPLHVAFTIKEIRELSKLYTNSPQSKCFINFLPKDVFSVTMGTDNQIEKLLSELPRPRRRLTEFLLKMHNSPDNKTIYAESPIHHCNLQFLRYPTEIISNEENYPNKNRSIVSHIKLATVKLEGPVSPHQQGIVDSSQPLETLPCGLVVRSIGYRGVCIDPDLPFDEHYGVILCKDSHGRVIDLPQASYSFTLSPMYCTGWIKRGPVGVIVDTAVDARQTAEAVLNDLSEFEKHGHVDVLKKDGFSVIQRYLTERNVHVVRFEDWERVDEAEKLAGQVLGKPREKLTTIQSMLKAAFVEVGQCKSPGR
ncbi:NADPH:adrenodoxin oxidoreductase, mitochondrial [Schistosoma japonicum]|nr:NADPH:adrenodoxin oxidoreductase, mitochondrial [Schistosoma japonicum]